MIVAGSLDKNNPSFQPFVSSQITSLRNKGIEIDILSIDSSESRMNYFLKIFALKKLVRKNRYDVIHCHYSYCGFVGCTQTKIPVVISFMGCDVLGDINNKGNYTTRGRPDNVISHILARLATSVIVKSWNLKEALRCPSAYVIPNGVDFAVFRPILRVTARRWTGLEMDKKYVLFAADPSNYRKGFLFVKDAVELLTKEEDCKDIELLVVNNRPQHDVVLYLNASDMLVLPSYHEGSPNIIKEAMACNVPILATDVGDIREIIGNTRGCFLIRRNAGDIADKMKLIFSNDIFETEGRDRIEHLRIEEIADEIVRVYQDTLKQER